MASPFHHFRRHQKTLLAIFGVIIMFVFVIGSALQNAFNPRGGGAQTGDETVVTWKGGSLTEAELRQAYETHRLVVNFLQAVVAETQEKNGIPIAPGVGMNQFNQMNPGIPIAYNEQTVVETLLLAEQARKMGMVVNDEAIYDFLENQLSVGLLTRGDLARLLEESTFGRINDAQMFEAIKTELLAQNMRLMGQSALFAERRPIVTPAKAWDYYLRLNQRANVELLPLKVADFVSQVKAKPTDAELQSLYDKHKDQFSSPESPEPGFQQRQKLAFEYLKGRLSDFREREMANITDEQIKAEYDRRVANGQYRVTESAPSEGETTTPEPDGTDAEPAAETTKPEDTKPESSSTEAPPASDSTEPKPDTPAAPTAEPEPPTPAPEPSTSDSPAPTEPANETPAEPDKPESPTTDKPAPEEQGRASSISSRFVSLQDEPAGEPSNDEEPAADPAAEPAAPDEAPKDDSPSKPAAPTDEPSSSAPADPAESAPAEAASSDEKPAASNDEKPAEAEPKETSDKPAEVSTTSETATTEHTASEPSATEQPEAKIQPLEEVRLQIIESLAEQPARQKMNAAVKAAETALSNYYNRLTKWEAMKDTDAAPANPKPIDIQALAKEHGLIVGSVPLSSPLEVGEYELGKAMDFSFAGGQFRQITFPQIAYGPNVALYEPRHIGGFLDEEYVFWAVEKEDEHVPPFDKIRDTVAEAWTKQRAFELAKQEAGKMAEQAAKAKKPLAEVFADKAADVFIPEPFSWMTSGAVPQMAGMPHLSEVDAVDYAGRNFMESIFSLQPGQVGVATDQPEEMVYVARLIDMSPSIDLLRDMFMETKYVANDRDPTLFIAFQDRNQVFGGWYENLEESLNVQWVRPAKMLIGG